MRSLRLTDSQVNKIVNHALRDAPREVCGLIGGRGETAAQIIPLSNAAEHPQQRYTMPPDELLRAFKQLDTAGLELIGVYHSHPQGNPLPSQEDIREAQQNTPNTIHLIIGLKGMQPRLQAWHIDEGRVDAVELLIGTSQQVQSNTEPPLNRVQRIAVILSALLSVLLLLLISFSLLPPPPPI